MADQKILMFMLGEEIYAIPALKTKEIIGMIDIVKVPNTPDFLKGIINIRGKIIPVMDLRLKLGMPEKDHDERTCILIVSIDVSGKEMSLGLVVDVVFEVTSIMSEDIESPEECNISADNNMVAQIGKLKDKIIMILDLSQLVSSGDLDNITE